MLVEIPVPIQFSPHKHHLRFLLSKIGEWQTDQQKEWLTEMLLIGNNLFDFYLGDLSPIKSLNNSDSGILKLWQLFVDALAQHSTTK